MKFSVSASYFLKKLLIANGAVGTNAVLPSLEDFLFRLEGNQLHITATDLETSIVTEIEVEGSEDGVTAIPAKILVDTLRSLPEQPVTIDVDEENRSATITTNTGKYKLACDNHEEYPTLPQIDEDSTPINLYGGIVKNAITKTSFATSNDELRLAMTGVLFSIDFNKIHFVATDAHKLVRYSFLDIKSDDAKSFIVPKKSLLLLRQALPDDVDVTLNYNNSHAFFHFDSTLIGIRLVDAQYPNYSAVIPNDNPIKVSIERLPLLNALKRISIFANKTTNQVVLNINQNAIVIEAQDIDFSNEATETISCSYEDDPITIGFNAKFLIEMLSVLDTDEVKLELSSPNKAGILLPSTQSDDEDLLMLVMPVMLNR